uniref:Uncharacterized protein n=1 Tax=Rhizophora mucronata TaxID=61149 RepID=A0A2P2L0G1_RHIMU
MQKINNQVFYLSRSLIRNFEAKDCLQARGRFINSNGCEKLQIHIILLVCRDTFLLLRALINTYKSNTEQKMNQGTTML